MIDEDEDWTPTPQAELAAEPAPTRRGRPAWAANLRTIRRHRCPRCKTWLWSALDADLLAHMATVDAGTFLNAAGEARALERGRRTWDYFTIPARRIEVREEDHRRHWPAGELLHGRTALVLVEHVHGRPAPDWGRYAPPRPPRKRRSTSDKPPF